jgi:hypothetical protein
MKNVESPTEAMLVSSIRGAIWSYYVALFAWIGFLLYATAYKDGWLLFDSIIFLIAAVNFNLSQKIDKARLELLRKG